MGTPAGGTGQERGGEGKRAAATPPERERPPLSPPLSLAVEMWRTRSVLHISTAKFTLPPSPRPLSLYQRNSLLGRGRRTQDAGRVNPIGGLRLSIYFFYPLGLNYTAPAGGCQPSFLGHCRQGFDAIAAGAQSSARRRREDGDFALAKYYPPLDCAERPNNCRQGAGVHATPAPLGYIKNFCVGKAKRLTTYGARAIMLISC
jgi:hypothetical protein